MIYTDTVYKNKQRTIQEIILQNMATVLQVKTCINWGVASPDGGRIKPEIICLQIFFSDWMP